MHEVLPGVFHWPAKHPRIHIEVSSYWLDEPGVLCPDGRWASIPS